MRAGQAGPALGVKAGLVAPVTVRVYFTRPRAGTDRTNGRSWSNQKPLHRGSRTCRPFAPDQFPVKEDRGFIVWLGIGSLFTIIIICLKHPKTLALWLREPLAAVGIIGDIGERMVGDDIINQVIASDVPKLVCLLWRMDKYIANANGYGLG